LEITRHPNPLVGDGPLGSSAGGADAARRPAFLVTVDTEGDNLWSRPGTITTRNAQYLPRFQSLCEKYRLKPTYLVNWEMSQSAAFVELGRDVLSRDAGEVGMHLHAWNSPPIVPLTADDNRFQPYLIEYPEQQIREKVKVMTETLAEVFGHRPTSHRAGRWGFDATYATILIEHGYTVDCSVTPHVSWQFCKGDPSKDGGTDYTDFPEAPYFLDPMDISRPGQSRLLELPVTVVQTRQYPVPIEHLRRRVAGSFFGMRVMRKAFPNTAWLMPTGSNGLELLRVLDVVRNERRPYAQFVIHSSELMPGGSPKLADPRAIDKLYEDMERLFAAASDCVGQTLSEFRERWPG
jgi:peptidoglycan/xylan/chitin deacetylase (PgdA/CDA1 family)